MNGWKRYTFGRPEDIDAALTRDDVARICREAARIRPELADYPLDNVLRFFERVHERWSDPAYVIREETEELLSREAQFSRTMISRGIEALVTMFDPQSLKRAVELQLGAISRTGHFQMIPGSDVGLRWYPCGVLLHVLAGNTFLSEIRALINGILTANVNILKTPSSNPRFLPKILESFFECDEDGVLRRSLAVLNFPSGDKEVLAEFKSRVDGIVVWGGEDAARAYRDDLPARCKLVIYGPKMSLAIVTRRGLENEGPAATARKLALAVSAWDQAICFAPQACFVEGLEQATVLAEHLAKALDELTQKLPPGRIDMHTAIEIQKLRAIFEVAEARGEGLLLKSKQGLDWTVILDPGRTLETSPLHRTIRIIPFQDFREVAACLEDWRGYIQTVGLLAGPQEDTGLSAQVSEIGALCITGLGNMTKRSWDEPHDGAYELPQLMRLVSRRMDVNAPIGAPASSGAGPDEGFMQRVPE